MVALHSLSDGRAVDPDMVMIRGRRASNSIIEIFETPIDERREV
jgi:hypothetical protein